MNTTRPTIHETLIAVAFEFAKRSTCTRLGVGSVIADARGVILSSGFNGAVAGMPHCNHDDDEPCKTSLHAEANAIIWAARRGIAIEGQIIYCTHEPCYECSKLIAQAGIAEVHYSNGYERNSGRGLLREAGIPLFCNP